MIIGQLTNTDGSFLVGREKNDDFDWQELKGKTIIGGRPGGMPLMTLMYVLNQKRLTPGTDVNVRTDIQFNLMAGAFEGSDADYVTLFEPTASLCEKEGIGFIVASVGAESGPVSYTAYMVRKSLLEENRDLYLRFIRAVAKGQQWVAEHTPEEIAAAIAPQFPDADVELLTTVARNYQSIGAWCETPVMNEEAFTRMQDIIEASGELSTRVPLEAIVDNTIAQAAIGK
jgi:NitT/TauT family transport system substrate-binding protein